MIEALLAALDDTYGVWTFGENGDAPGIIALWRGGPEVEMWLRDSGGYDLRERLYFNDRPERAEVIARILAWTDEHGTNPTRHRVGCRHVAVYDGDGTVSETELVCVPGCRATF